MKNIISGIAIFLISSVVAAVDLSCYSLKTQSNIPIMDSGLCADLKQSCSATLTLSEAYPNKRFSMLLSLIPETGDIGAISVMAEGKADQEKFKAASLQSL